MNKKKTAAQLESELLKLEQALDKQYLELGKQFLDAADAAGHQIDKLMNEIIERKKQINQLSLQEEREHEYDTR